MGYFGGIFRRKFFQESKDKATEKLEKYTGGKGSAKKKEVVESGKDCNGRSSS